MTTLLCTWPYFSDHFQTLECPEVVAECIFNAFQARISTIITPRAYARSKVIGHVIVVAVNKNNIITKSGDTGT